MPKDIIIDGIPLSKILAYHNTWRPTEGEKGDSADLVGADLSRADFIRADLSGANLRWAALIGTDFNEAETEGTLGPICWEYRL